MSTYQIVHPTHCPPINLTEVKNYECFRSSPQVCVSSPLYTIGCVNFDKVYILHNTGRGSIRPDKIIWTNNILSSARSSDATAQKNVMIHKVN